MTSFVVVNYKTRDLLRQCLRSIETHCPDAQIVVVDNGSNDDSPAMVRNEFPRAVLIESETNLGFAGGNNLGLAKCTGEFIILFNSDATLEDDSIARCEQYLRDHPQVGALSPRLMGIDGRRQRCIYRFPTLKGKLREIFRSRLSDDPEPGDGWLAGTALMLRKTALDQIGGELDGEYFMYWEDADLSARLRAAGWEIATLEEPYVRHYGGASGGGADTLRRLDLHAWFLYGRLRWYRKNRSAFTAAGAWLLELSDVPRDYLRTFVRPSFRNQRQHAITKATVLFRFLFGIAPPLPGRRKKEAPKPVISLKTSSA